MHCLNQETLAESLQNGWAPAAAPPIESCQCLVLTSMGQYYMGWYQKEFKRWDILAFPGLLKEHHTGFRVVAWLAIPPPGV